MSEQATPYGAQPLIPSDRVTGAELLEWEASTATFGPIVYGRHDDPEVAGMLKVIEERQRLVAEIRRYRALLLGLARDECPRAGDGGDEGCVWCGAGAIMTG